MVDAERLRSILQRITDDLVVLRPYSQEAPVELLANAERLRSIKYLFATIIEGCIDAAQHVCSSEGWGPPANNADAMRVLGTHGAIDGTLAASMASAVGFRNILVHLYAKVDDSKVVEMLDRLGDLDTFVAALAPLAR